MKIQKLKIRDFNKEDVDAVMRIQSQYLENFEFEVSKEFILYVSDRYDFRLFVAIMDKNVIGFAGTMLYDEDAELGPIAVDQEFVSRGVGTALVGKILDLLHDLGVKRVFTRSKINNKIASEFFLKQGFKEEGEMDDMGVIKMVRYLKVAPIS